MQLQGSACQVGVDARLLAYSRAGIAQYIRCLLHALRALNPAEKVVPLYHRKQRGEAYGPFGGAKASSPFPLSSGAEERLSASGMTRTGATRRLWTPPHHRLESWLLAAELLPRQLDLFHAPDHIVPRGLRCRKVVTVHDLSFLRYPQTHTPASLRYYGQIFRSIEAADCIIAVSDATRRELISLVGAKPDRVRVIPEAPTLDYVDGGRPGASVITTAAAEGGAPAARRPPWPYFLCVGTIEPRKNLSRVLDALSRLEREHQRFGLVLAGAAGPGMGDVQGRIRELGLCHRVLLWGAPTPAELRWLYADATALVFASIYEGFGLPILDAFASGTPVITSSVSSMPEVAGDAALLVDPFRVEEIAAALRRVVSDAALCRELRARGAARVRLFSWERTAAATLNVYREVLRA